MPRTTARIAALAAAHPQLAGKTLAVGTLVGTNRWGTYGQGDPRADFLTALGMRNAPAVQALTTSRSNSGLTSLASARVG